MKSETESSRPARPLNVLIVDDSATMRLVIRRVAKLSEAPIGSLFEAANGREALRILEGHQIDALFTDIAMPVMSGTELLQEIAKRDKWNNLLRVIISSDGSEARRAAVADLNVRMFVEKPLRPEVLRDVLSVLA